MKNNNNENIELNKKDFSFLGPMQIKDMRAVEGGYFCEECNKKVHDVSGMSKEKYHDLVSKTENICVTFKKVATVSLALSMAASATDTNSSNIKIGKIAIPTEVHESSLENNNSKNMVDEVFTGDIMLVESPQEDVAEDNNTLPKEKSPLIEQLKGKVARPKKNK